MLPNATIRDILRMYRNGEVSEDEAAGALEGLRIEVLDGMARIDAGRSVRCGMPEVVLAEGKEPEAFAEIMLAQVKAAGRCVATRLSPEHLDALRARLPPDVRMEHREAARAVILSTGDEPVPPRGGTVAIPFDNIASILFRLTTDKLVASVKLADGSTMELAVDKKHRAFGQTEYGTFQIQLVDLKKMILRKL